MIGEDFRQPTATDDGKPDKLSRPEAMLAYVAVPEPSTCSTAAGWPGSTTTSPVSPARRHAAPVA